MYLELQFGTKNVWLEFTYHAKNFQSVGQIWPRKGGGVPSLFRIPAPASLQYCYTIVKKRVRWLLLGTHGHCFNVGRANRIAQRVNYRMRINVCGMYILWMPCGWGFLQLYFCEALFCLKISQNMWITIVTTQQPNVHFLSDLTRYCCFGETCTGDIVRSCRHVYNLCRYAVAAMAIMCTSQSGQFR